jgi:hypothetical protein|tara:strand:+ start:8150 stop:8296 length:147 start_codon:yes stop_codon:yes gene_type:complete
MMMLGFSAAEERLMKKSEPIMGVGGGFFSKVPMTSKFSRTKPGGSTVR